MYSSLDARSTVRASTGTRPAYKTCLRTPQREDAVPKSTEARRQFTRTEPSPEGVWGLCDVAPVSEERTPNGCAAPTRRRGSTGKPNPVRQSARLAETAIARETAARRRRGGPGSLSLSVSLSPLSVDRRHGARSSSSKRSARVQLCWDITPGAAAAAAAALCKERHFPAFPAAGRWPRGAVGPGAEHDGVPGPRGGRRGPFGGAASLGEVRRGRSQAATCMHGPRRGPSATPQKTVFKPPELNSCVGGAKS